jgi:hypothetical protein
MKIKRTALIAALCLFTLPAYAQEDKATTPTPVKAPKEAKQMPLDYPVAYRYQPEYCDFTAAFPEEPILSTVCEKEDDPQTCFELASYTKVFEMTTTVGVKVICNPANKEMFEYFTAEVMENTVRKMTEGSVVETFNVDSTEKEGYRLTGLIGQGKKGLDKTLFIAQLWISENSIMSVEAEISGDTLAEADALFAGLLNHVGYTKEIIPETPKEAPKE